LHYLTRKDNKSICYDKDVSVHCPTMLKCQNTVGCGFCMNIY